MSLEQIGQKLKSARENQGLTLTQIWERTKIPMHHLQSMEQGVTDDLPETVYVAGFIKRYADLVGLNGQALSEEYRQDASPESNGNGNGHFMLPSKPISKGSTPQVVVLTAPQKSKTRMDGGQFSVMKTLIFPLLCAIMLLCLLAWLLKWHSDSESSQTPDSSLLNMTNKFNQVPASTPNVAPPGTAPTQPGAQQPTPPPTSSGISVDVSASKHVWVEIKAISSGENKFTGYLESGQTRNWNDPSGIWVRAGNGGSVSISIDGKSELLGAAGKVTERTFMSKNPAAVGTTAGVGATGTIDPKTGNVLGAAGTTALKPPVKKTVKKPSDATAAHKRRSSDDSGSHGYGSGDGAGGSRSTDVPYRYTEGPEQ